MKKNRQKKQKSVVCKELRRRFSRNQVFALFMIVVVGSTWAFLSTRDTDLPTQERQVTLNSTSKTTIKTAPSPVSSSADESSQLDISSLLTGPRDAATPVANREESSIHWNGIPESKKAAALLPHMVSNIRKGDYAGAESCKECHAENYENWQRHSHRLMNALATDETVLGDFSGAEEMEYLGGSARFFKEDNERYMHLERGGVERLYRITRTIGSRFTQYYVGLLEDGPDSMDHPARTVDHVLPLGWWIDRGAWVPVVHVDNEGPDGTRWDAFAEPSDIPYDGSCAACHTTPAIGDWMLDPTGIKRLGYFAHVPVSFDVREYLTKEHPELVPPTTEKMLLTQAEKFGIIRHFRDTNAVGHAVNLGISCESCHNGSAEHVQASDHNKSAVLPHFFPASEHFIVEADDPQRVFGRSKESINFICARCHSGGRPTFASGIATWNSVEFSDAEVGYCYIRKHGTHPDLDVIACTDCHDPHAPIGQAWNKTPEEDDMTCLNCHKNYVEENARYRHTRHKAGTDGDRCLNCHMPRINEGLEGVVRTHAISNPTWARMIEANHPNACNLCHLDQSINWTITWLSRWYRIDRYGSYDLKELDKNYSDRNGPVGLEWLKSSHEPTRLVATDAFARQNAKWGIPDLITMLDDPYLINRQFTMVALERMLGVRLDEFGYYHYLTPAERKIPIEKIRGMIPPTIDTK